MGFEAASLREVGLTLGAEAWSGPIRRIEAASFLASSVLFSSCLQCGKFLVREGLQSVWGPWTWCRQRKEWTQYTLTDLCDQEQPDKIGKSVCSIRVMDLMLKTRRSSLHAGQMTHHLARLPFHLAGPIVLVHLCSCSVKMNNKPRSQTECTKYFADSKVFFRYT